MQNSDLKLGEALKKAASIDKARLDEEMKATEEHVFSDEFNRKMENVFQIAKKKSKFTYIKRYAAVAVLALVFIGGALWLTGPGSTNASKPGIDILEWAQNYFSFKTGDDAIDEDGILFDESQIGFIPEGFEKAWESVDDAHAKYKYTNASDDYIIFRASNVSSSVYVNNENIIYTTDINAAGYEYIYVYDKVNNVHQFYWEDETGYFYSVIGTLNIESMIQIMDSIKYER